MTDNELLRQLKVEVSHKEDHINFWDERKVACMFFRSLRDGKFSLAEIEDTV